MYLAVEQIAKLKDLVHCTHSVHNLQGMKLNCENEGDNREACLMFKAVDADSSGKITVAEGTDFINKLVEEHFRAHVAEHVQQIIHGHDVNNDGELDYSEFLQSIQEAEGSPGGCG
jgi:Ca2+-binding EF-hand superfamily protein